MRISLGLLAIGSAMKPPGISKFGEAIDFKLGFPRAEGAFPNQRYGDRKVGESGEMRLRYFGT